MWRRRRAPVWSYVLPFCLGFGTCAFTARLFFAQPASAASPGSFRLASPAEVVKTAGDAVVSLEAFSSPRRPRAFSLFAPASAEDDPTGVASGVIFSPEGHVLTNNHVVKGAQWLRARLGTGREYDAQVVGCDPHTDLAVLKLTGRRFHPIRFGDSQAIQPGDSVVAIGNPLGFEQSVSMGIVSAIRTGPFRVGEQTLGDMIQTDAAINQGNSGGGLFAADGKLVGINTAIMVTTGSSGSIGIGFAVPAHRVRPVAEAILRRGRVPRPWLGISYQPSPPAFFDHRPRHGAGVRVDHVADNGPAHRAGIKPADVLQRIGDCAIRAPEDFYTFMDRHQAGDRLRAKVLRGGKVRTVTLLAAERPAG
jgi:S1-C subfamily serine protease